MFQKGPGEDFHAAKEEVLAINPDFYCRRCEVPGIGSFHRVYLLTQSGPVKYGEGKLARDAWSDALTKLEAEWDQRTD